MMKLCVYISLLFFVALSPAGWVNTIGNYSGWDTVNWKPITAQNDGVNSGITDSYLDIVGSGNDSAAYWASDGSYVYFRMRVRDSQLVTTYDNDSPNGVKGSYMVMIDVQGSYYDTTLGGLVEGTANDPDDGLPDYAFVWDAQNHSESRHGLEMSVRPNPNWGTVDSWSDINFDDIDGSDGQKLTNDINGDGRTTDGYVRIVDGIATSDSNFATTSFVEIAVSSSYLDTYTDLDFENQDWEVGFATIADSTDHANLNADIGGGADLTDDPTVLGLTEVPEPMTLAILGFGALFVGFRRRR